MRVVSHRARRLELAMAPENLRIAARDRRSLLTVEQSVQSFDAVSRLGDR